MANVTVIEATKDTSLVGKLRCAAYCRVSSNSEDQLHSYAAQVKYYTKILGCSDNETLADIYADEGITGTCQDKREEFQRMMKDCRKGKIDRIYTKSVSRFARNTKDCLQSIRELKGLGISVYFEKENIDTANIPDELMITIMGALAQEESTSISQNMRWSIKKRMENGTMKLNTPPFGYKLVNGELKIDQKEAAVVRQIFNRYLNGYGSFKIAQMLNDAGVAHNGRNGCWTEYYVRCLLKNEKYIGDRLCQKEYTTATLPHKKAPNRGELPQYYYSKCHEPIISDEEYYKVQNIMQTRRELTSNGNRSNNSVFSQKIKCGLCKKTYKFRKINGKCYWICREHLLRSDYCQSKPIPEESIKQAFVRLCNKLYFHYKEILIPVQRTLRELNAKRFIGNTKVYDMRREIAELKEQKHVISRLRTKGFIDEQKYVEQTTSLESRIEKLNRELHSISRADDDDTLEQLDMLIDIFESRSEIFTEFDEDVFTQIVEKITVKDNTLEFELMSDLKFSEKIQALK